MLNPFAARDHLDQAVVETATTTPIAKDVIREQVCSSTARRQRRPPGKRDRHQARANSVRYDRPQGKFSAIVEDAHKVTARNAPGLSIVRMYFQHWVTLRMSLAWHVHVA